MEQGLGHGRKAPCCYRSDSPVARGHGGRQGSGRAVGVAPGVARRARCARRVRGGARAGGAAARPRWPGVATASSAAGAGTGVRRRSACGESQAGGKSASPPPTCQMHVVVCLEAHLLRSTQKRRRSRRHPGACGIAVPGRRRGLPAARWPAGGGRAWPWPMAGGGGRRLVGRIWSSDRSWNTKRSKTAAETVYAAPESVSCTLGETAGAGSC